MTQFYIGCKQVEAWPEEKNGKAGYAVKYPDGYTSWSPKDVFETAYLPMGWAMQGDQDNTNRITQQMVDAFICSYRTMTVGKTTIVHATLANGFELVESSSCVDLANYNDAVGERLCVQKIKDRVWHLLGFLLQTARNGVQQKSSPA